jgi:hypothetical protein
VMICHLCVLFHSLYFRFKPACWGGAREGKRRGEERKWQTHQ